MKWQLALQFTLTSLSLAHLRSQTPEPRINQARQLDLQTVPLPAAGDFAPTELPASSGDDGDSFGVQQLLRDEERLRPFRTFADVSAFVTSNVALTRVKPATDAFLLATFGFEYRRPVPRGFQIDAGLRLATFRYNEFRQLDFNSIDAGVGVSYHTSKLTGLDLFLRYNFNELLGVKSGDVFFTNHTLALGAQKTVVFSSAHYAFAGVTGQLGFSDAKSAERSEASVFAGYHVQLTRNLQSDLLYRYAGLFYTEGGRTDRNQTLSWGLRYRFTDWSNVSASGYLGRNRSNRAPFSYDVANGGGGLTFNLQF